ncbi:hypothetical protein BDR07DRAFT_1385942 [Suillus spraguei]|nr:hypothetical protein BDR07DRAFT_1385942 [Suillus spraguei]
MVPNRTDLDGTMYKIYQWYQIELELDGTMTIYICAAGPYIYALQDHAMQGKRYIMVPNGTGPRWDYVRDISWYQLDLDLDGTMTIYICAVQDISMVPNRTRTRWDYVRDISWYQIDLDLNGTM